MSTKLYASHTNIFILLFVSYVILAVLKVVSGIDAVFYFLIPIFLGLIMLPISIRGELYIGPLVLFLFSLLFGGTLYFTRTSDVGSYFPLFMLCYLSLFVFYTKFYSQFNLLWVSNCCYLIYLAMSIVSYFLLSSYYRSIESEIIASRVFHGIEGTPASIDSFSIFVFLINYFYNKGNSRWLLYFLSLSAIAMAGATTPILVLLVVFLSYVFLKLFKSFSILLTLFFMVMFGVFYLSISDSAANAIILVATNGRNIIWDQQIENLGYFNIFFGDVSSAIVKIPWSTGSALNPHNVFLFIILRFGIVFFSMLVVLLAIKGRVQDTKKKLLLMAYLGAGISNANLFYIANPFYFYMLCFCLSSNNKVLSSQKIFAAKRAAVNIYRE